MASCSSIAEALQLPFRLVRIIGIGPSARLDLWYFDFSFKQLYLVIAESIATSLEEARIRLRVPNGSLTS